MKILIVEDDPSIKSTLEALCGEYWRVQKCHFAKSISESIWYLTRERPDIILLDLLLEGELAEPIVTYIREKFPVRPPRIIAMSALNNGAQLAALYRIPEYLKKPFDIDTLEEFIFKK